MPGTGVTKSAGAFDVFGDEVLEGFLATADANGFLVGAELRVVEFLQARPTGDVARGLPTGVAVGAACVEFAVVDDRRRHHERPRHRVHPTDVRVEQVVAVGRLTPQLGIEVHAAGREPAAAEDLQHRQRHLLDGHGEAVEVPTETVVAGVGIDRTEDACAERRRDLVGEIVAGERGVVDLDVDLDLVLQSVLLQEGVNGGDVVVVLVLRRLERLRLDQDEAVEPDGVLVFDDEVEEPAELVELAGMSVLSSVS